MDQLLKRKDCSSLQNHSYVFTNLETELGMWMLVIATKDRMITGSHINKLTPGTLIVIYYLLIAMI